MSKSVILCVDDEKIILQSLRDQLQHNFGNQFIYEFAESADEALEVIEDLVLTRQSILLIVSDWLMPSMRGDELLIRVHKRYPDIITVMLTGQADDQAIERARRHANLFNVVTKPWDEATLVDVIQSGLKERHV
ncbi:MAG: response regulator [Synechococcaceae cyanobacterium SM2_3_1]|nr:response regulator [Synechococcaceae cyanobacterium SM2_3_1]